MVDDCRSLARSIARVVEGDASPGDALRVALHVADCTHCKIVHARERRLAALLENDLPELAIGDDVVEAVMEGLPEGPPPGSARSGRGRRRGLRLASLVTGLVGLTAAALRAVPGADAGSLPGLPEWRLDTALPLVDPLASIAGAIWLALAGAGSSIGSATATEPAAVSVLLACVAGVAIVSTSLCGVVAFGAVGAVSLRSWLAGHEPD